MKTAFLVVCSLAILGSITAFGWGGRCQKQSNCEDDECCVKYNAWYGSCSKRGEEGEVCVPDTGYNKFHKAMCPCQEGLECVAGPKGKFPHTEFIQQPLCKPKPTTQPPPAESS